ncbi:hypothetical protein ZIOFF_073629 [Zingiber officinale]|uniref:Uncharacterized protein n=1 Tax=Zingiber officinale TaxID=94328 RepID=A0A8J5CTF1_ZINOF|nr:hypothetical protein ZIOFF_073629 [Zingiber officinale]
MQSPTHAACGVCCAFLRRPNSLSRLGYQPLPPADASPAEPPVRVVVGKERRVFFVDRLVLERDHFRILMEAAGDRIQRRKGAVLVDLDAILFEHLLCMLKEDSIVSFSSVVARFKILLRNLIKGVHLEVFHGFLEEGFVFTESDFGSTATVVLVDFGISTMEFPYLFCWSSHGGITSSKPS